MQFFSPYLSDNLDDIKSVDKMFARFEGLEGKLRGDRWNSEWSVSNGRGTGACTCYNVVATDSGNTVYNRTQVYDKQLLIERH